jgi:hypothetical protein
MDAPNNPPPPPGAQPPSPAGPEPVPPTSPPPGPQPAPPAYGPHSVAHNYQATYGYGAGMPPPDYRQRSGMPRWVLILVIALVVIFGGCGAMVWLGLAQLRSAGVLPNVPKAKVHTGTPIQWVELAKWKAQGGMFMPTGPFGGGLASGSFDADPAPELLYIEPNSAFAPSGNGIGVTVVELTGTSRTVTLSSQSFAMGCTAWDYEGDGTPEIVTLSNPTTDVYNHSGKKVATLPASDTFGIGGQTQADIDGDGKPELLLTSANGSGNPVAIGLKGKQVWSGGSYAQMSWANVDADPLAEQLEYNGTALVGTDMQGQVTTLTGWPSGTYTFNYLCADVDADGRDEIIDAENGFLNPATGTFHNFQGQPSGNVTFGGPSSSLLQAYACAGDFDGDGTRELVVTGSGGNTGFSMGAGTAVLMYDALGKEKYYEEFGQQVVAIAPLKDGKRDRLAVLLNNKLLVTP